MNTKPNMIFGLMALAGALAFSSAGFAQSPSAENSVSDTVHYADLNLSTPRGIRTLYYRIEFAAWNVCTAGGAVGVDNVRCKDSAVDTAVRDVNKPALTAMHTGRKLSTLTAAR